MMTARVHWTATSSWSKVQQEIFGFSFSRASSVGSVNAISCSSASSTHNTDDEDSDVAAMQSNSFKERRREAHTHAEQKRRDAIKKGYEELQSVVPTCTESSSSQKLSKATILQKSIDYIQYLRQQKKKHEDELENLKKEAMALGIMKSNYEQLVRNCQNVDPQGSDQVSDEEKFYVFQQLVDNLFQTFNTSVAVSSFEELSQCVTTWLEDNCKPNMLRELMMNILSGSNISSSN